MYNGWKSAISFNGRFMKTSFLGLLLMTVVSSALAQAPASPTSKRSDLYFHFSMARQLDEQGQWNQAIDEYKKALEIEPNNSVVYAEMADTYRRNNRVREAVEAAKKAVELN